jgi:hypothetical protein
VTVIIHKAWKMHVSLRREYNVNTLGKVENTLRLYRRVVGSMRHVIQDTVIWQGIETFISPQAYTLDEYMAEDGKLLRQDIDTGLKHIAARLAND